MTGGLPVLRHRPRLAGLWPWGSECVASAWHRRQGSGPRKTASVPAGRALYVRASRSAFRAGSAAPAFRIAARHPAAVGRARQQSGIAVEMRRKILEIQACVNASRGSPKPFAETPGPGPRAASPCMARGDKAGEPVPAVSRRWGLAVARRQRCGREGGRTGVCAPGLRNRTGKVSERPGWPGADIAGRSVVRISDPGSHAVRVRAALTVCLCAGFLYAKGVPPRARPSAGWWLSAPIFRNTHNPDRRAPCRSVDGPPQE